MRRLDLTADEARALSRDGTASIIRHAFPLAIVPRTVVRADVMPGMRMPSDGLCARPDREYPVELNPQGAVTAVLERGRLGIKPREFDFVCPLAEGRTYLDGCWRIDVLIGDFTFTEGIVEARGRIRSVVLDRLTGEWIWRAEAVRS